jgi:ArsR family transcriptional regulator
VGKLTCNGWEVNKIEHTDFKKLYEIQADVCKTLGNAKRIAIIHALSAGELSVSEIVNMLGISSANVSQHLAVMKHKGILLARRDGVAVFYRLSNPKVNQACSLMREVLVEKFEEGQKMAKDFAEVK